MTPAERDELALDTLAALASGWRGQWEIDAFDGLVLRDGEDATELDDMDGDAKIELAAMLNAIDPAVAAARAEIDRLRRLGLEACGHIDSLTEGDLSRAAASSRATADRIRKELSKP